MSQTDVSHADLLVKCITKSSTDDDACDDDDDVGDDAL